MTTIEAAGQRYHVVRQGRSLLLVGVEARLDEISVQLPEGWEPVPGEPDEYVWVTDQVAQFRVRLRSGEHLTLDGDLVELGGEARRLEPIVLRVRAGKRPPVQWLAGAAGEVVVGHDDGPVLLSQRRGICSHTADDDGIALFGDPMLVWPGQTLSSSWRVEPWPPGRWPPEPAWVPVERHQPWGEPVVVDQADAAVVAPEDVTVRQLHATTELVPTVGLHSVQLRSAPGTVTFEVGAYDDIASLLEPSRLPATSSDVAVWLGTWQMAHQVPGAPTVDELDRLLGEALEEPSLWGILAGIQALATTDLPVEHDVSTAAAVLARKSPASEALPIIAVFGLTRGRGILALDEMIATIQLRLGGAWEALAGPDDSWRRLAAAVEYGRISSRPPRYSARDVAMADLWLASRPDSALHVELGDVSRRARARLMCLLSVEPDPLELAWLLVGHELW